MRIPDEVLWVMGDAQRLSAGARRGPDGDGSERQGAQGGDKGGGDRLPTTHPIPSDSSRPAAGKLNECSPGPGAWANDPHPNPARQARVGSDLLIAPARR